MILRNFLFLNTNSMNDYLSALEGYIVEETDVIESQKSQLGGKAGMKIVEGNTSTETHKETKKKVAITDVSKFQRLYELMEDNNLVQYLDAFDEEIWNDIKRGEIIEVPVKAKVPNTFKLLQEAESITPFVELFRTLRDEDFLKKEDTDTLNGIKAISELSKNQDIPLILEIENTPGYSLITRLSPNFIRCELEQLQGEVTIIGKVSRIVPKGKKEEIFSLIPNFDGIYGKMNRDQKRKFNKDKSNKNISDSVKGPAFILDPLAIYK